MFINTLIMKLLIYFWLGTSCYINYFLLILENDYPHTICFMKEVLIKDLSKLLMSDNAEEMVNLKVKVSHLIKAARFDLESESELHTKNLIISTINNYVETSDSALKTALSEHLKTIESYIKE